MFPYILLQVLWMMLLTKQYTFTSVPQEAQNGFCEASNLECTDRGQTVELKITLQKTAHGTGVPSGGGRTTELPMRDCADLYMKGQRQSGVYTIQPSQLSKPIQVYCDMTENGGGWTKLLRRQDGSVNFAQTWLAYKNGFGNVDGEHWVGTDNIAALTRQRLYSLRIRLWDFQNATKYADYSTIVVEPEWDKYRLHIGAYSGDAGDSFTFHNGQRFTTINADNDQNSGNCGQQYFAGNWFASCYRAGLTNLYSHTEDLAESWKGIVWNAWKGKDKALQKVDMKIRPVDF